MPVATRQLVGISIFSEEKKSGHSGIRLRRISGIQKSAVCWIPDHGLAVSGMTLSANLLKRLLIL